MTQSLKMEQVVNFDENGIIRLNIGGTVFMTYSDTLGLFSGSKLATLDRETKNYNYKTHEYFFDRNPVLFNYILDACRKGSVHIPRDVCGTTFKQELEFWGISSKHVASCCWEALYSSDVDVCMMDTLFDNFRQNTNMCLMLENVKTWRGKVWLFLDEPNSSRGAMIWGIFTSLLIVATTIIDALLTLPKFQESYTGAEKEVLVKMIDMFGYNNDTISRILNQKPDPNIDFANAMCYVILTIDFVLCFVVCPKKTKFMLCIYRNAILVGYLSFWISYIMQVHFSDLTNVHAMRAFVIFKYMTILKLGRLISLTKHIPAFTIVGLTFSSSIRELKILSFILGVLVCVFGYVMFVAEFFYNEHFSNIFGAMYWALITLTTVGYGDYTPNTSFGHVIASACAICGVICLALPIGVIASTFYKFYNFHSYAKTYVKEHGKSACGSRDQLIQLK